MIPAPPPKPKRKVLIVEKDLPFATALSDALTAAGIEARALIEPGLAVLYKAIVADPPDLVLFAQPVGSKEAFDVVRRHAPPHAQALLLLDRAGGAPPGMVYGVTDGFIWRDVGMTELVAFVNRALRRRGSLQRMRAAKAGS